MHETRRFCIQIREKSIEAHQYSDVSTQLDMITRRWHVEATVDETVIVIRIVSTTSTVVGEQNAEVSLIGVAIAIKVAAGVDLI